MLMRICIAFAMTFGVVPGTAMTASAANPMHQEIAAYEGAKTCSECHDATPSEVAATLHYRVSGVLTASGGPCGPAGSATGSNWIGLAQPKDPARSPQPDGCARCHAGSGAPPPQAAAAAADAANVDCLICHGPDYGRTVAREEIKVEKEIKKGKKLEKVTEVRGVNFRLVPATGVDPLKAAREAGKPTPEMCLRCHAQAGGGPNYYNGVVPTADSDIHASMGMNCTECHTVKQHRIAGGADLKAQESPEIRVACDNCHTDSPHKGDNGEILNRHCERIACQTCHIPFIARDPAMPTAVERDWTTPTLDPETGLYRPAVKLAAKVRPEYRWWNRDSGGVPEGDGAPRDPKAKLYPWKKTLVKLPADAASGKPVSLKSTVYAATGDVAAAARKGAEEAGQQFSGRLQPLEDAVFTSLNHQVAPKAEALQCDDCHSQHGGVMDMRKLKRRIRR